MHLITRVALVAAQTLKYFEVAMEGMASREEMDVMDYLVLKDHRESLELGGHLDHKEL